MGLLDFLVNCLQMEVFQSEKALLEAFVDATQSLDPDIILGFEVQKGSLGYLADRAATMELALLKLVSRTPEVCRSCVHLFSKWRAPVIDINTASNCLAGMVPKNHLQIHITICKLTYASNKACTDCKFQAHRVHTKTGNIIHLHAHATSSCNKESMHCCCSCRC